MEKNRLFGVGEPLTMRSMAEPIDPMETLELMQAVGFTAMREWMHIPAILDNPTTPKPAVVAAYTKVLDRCAALDIEVTGMSHEWFLPAGCVQTVGNAVPPRDLTPGSLYRQLLEMLEQSWFTLVSCFPQVPQWEVGNEWNIDIFLHPDGFLQSDRSRRFSPDEKMDIAVDLMYFSAKGIRRANPKAKVVSFSPTLSSARMGGDLPDYLPPQYGVAQALERIYSRIKSGRFWSDNPDDYFDLLAWHPYLFGAAQSPEGGGKNGTRNEGEPNELWREYNNAAYRVMQKYGDGHKQALITEFGFTDCGDPALERLHAQYFRKAFDICAELPYIRTLHAFRMYTQQSMLENNDPDTIGGLGEVYFGFFTEPAYGHKPRAKAVELQKICGGAGDLWKYAK